MAATVVHSGLPRAAVTFHDPPAVSEGVETDPNNRYLRYPLLLGRGACKRVYKAFDQVEGIEVAWNQVELAGSDLDEETRERLFAEIRVLKTLKHRNIMRFYDWWFDDKTMTINFITEYFTSGNLRQYRKKHKHISEQAIKRWAFQILEGLMYLHAHDPPIVHRDLKCDNILVNGTSGQVKIADLGLASCQRGLSVVGTPEFMAPEIYDEVYDEKVDIYSFGMCMLELATLEYPYSECRSIPAIFRKVSQGIPPAALAKVQSEPLREFITTCIDMDPKKRPGALQLLRHEFFGSLKPDGPDSDAAKHGDLNIPFGSCGNLLSLGASGSHAKTSFSRSSRPKTLSCAECTAAARAAKQAADEQAEEQAAQTTKAVATAGSAAAGQPPEQCPECGLPMESTSNSAQSSSQQAQQSNGKAADSVAIADSNFARGKSICLALLNRSEPEAYADNCEEDSDDEVIVALEDVLTPHPEDLMDPDTSHLHTTLTHAGSGCTIVSGPDCDLEHALSGLSMTGLLDQPSSVGSFSVSSHSIAQAPIALASKSAGQTAAGSRARSSAGSRRVSVGEAPPAVVSSAAAEEQETSNESSRPSDTVSPHGLRQKSATVAVANTPDSSSDRVAKHPGHRLSSHLSDVAPVMAELSSRSPSSSVPGGSPWIPASRNRGFHRSTSTLTVQPSRGQLAAAGLLQMSPGVFVSTPPLLGKLLSKNGRQMGRRTVAGHVGHKPSGSGITGGWDSEQSSFSSANRGSSQLNLIIRDFRTCSCGAAVLAGLASNQSAGQGPSPQHGLEGISQSLTGHWGHSSNGNQQESTLDLRQPTAQQQVTSRDPDSHPWDSQAAAEAASTGIRTSITLEGSVPAASLGAGHNNVPFPFADSLTPGLVNELNAAPASSSTAGAMFGKIVVRRKFARNLQKQAAEALKRSRSL